MHLDQIKFTQSHSCFLLHRSIRRKTQSSSSQFATLSLETPILLKPGCWRFFLFEKPPLYFEIVGAQESPKSAPLFNYEEFNT